MAYTEDDFDKMTRAVLGEAQGQPVDGQAGVAHVILNRAEKSGKSPASEVMRKGQFESLPKFKDYDPKSPEYQRARELVSAAAGGFIADPTGGATHFYAPDLQSKLGRKPPTWATDKTKTVEIGGHHFYAPEGRVERGDGSDDVIGQWLSAGEKPYQGDNLGPLQPKAKDGDAVGQWMKSGEAKGEKLPDAPNDVVKSSFDALPAHTQADLETSRLLHSGEIDKSEADRRTRINHLLRDHPDAAKVGGAMLGGPIAAQLAGLITGGVAAGTRAGYKAIPQGAKDIVKGSAKKLATGALLGEGANLAMGHGSAASGALAALMHLIGH